MRDRRGVREEERERLMRGEEGGREVMRRREGGRE